MRESRTSGSVRGALSNERPYREQLGLYPGRGRSCANTLQQAYRP